MPILRLTLLKPYCSDISSRALKFVIPSVPNYRYKGPIFDEWKAGPM
jgi:hypothetical protein